MRRPVKAAAATLALAGAIAVGGVATGPLRLGDPGASEPPVQIGLVDPVAAASLEPSASPSPADTATPSPTATPTPTPTPVPTPVLVRAPLSGRMVTEKVASQHPIALMIDDAPAARPQSGFNAASVVWQAPAEGGVPRYMLIFQDQMPRDVGPVRSARYYFITWAAEWKAVYGHVGGSPQAMATLRAKGNGQLVYNADQFRWGGTYYRRISQRRAPHNVYSDGKSLRIMATKVGAKNELLKPFWRFGKDAPLAERPSGGIIRVVYPQNSIEYRYDKATNTYLRGVSGQSKQIDAADGKRVAPKNVVIMMVSFGPLNDGSNKHRLEAKNVGSGKAWIATNGRTIQGTWKKSSLAGPTRFYDMSGTPVRLTAGQTFIQVMPLGSTVTIKDGTPPRPVATPTPPPTPIPSGSHLTSPNPSPSPS
jgi:hypothetical protein